MATWREPELGFSSVTVNRRTLVATCVFLPKGPAHYLIGAEVKALSSFLRAHVYGYVFLRRNAGPECHANGIRNERGGGRCTHTHTQPALSLNGRRLTR